MCSAFVIQHGILQGATFIKSDNFNARPADKTGLITGIVIHNISLPPSQFGQVNADGVHHVKAFFFKISSTPMIMYTFRAFIHSKYLHIYSSNAMAA